MSRLLKNETDNHEHSFLSVSSLLKNGTYNHEHSFLSMSSSLKNETDSPLIDIPQDILPEPSFPPPMSVYPLYSSLYSEPIPIIIQKYYRVQKKSRWTK
jgi:hypothetical protein